MVIETKEVALANNPFGKGHSLIADKIKLFNEQKG